MISWIALKAVPSLLIESSIAFAPLKKALALFLSSATALIGDQIEYLPPIVSGKVKMLWSRNPSFAALDGFAVIPTKCSFDKSFGSHE